MAKLARVQIVALVLAARSLQEADRDYALGLADCWNERIEEWTYVRGTDLDRRCGVPGHYVRLAPGRQGGLRGRPGVADEKPSLPAQQAVGMEFLYLARLGAAVARRPSGPGHASGGRGAAWGGHPRRARLPPL